VDSCIPQRRMGNYVMQRDGGEIPHLGENHDTKMCRVRVLLLGDAVCISNRITRSNNYMP